MKQLASLPWEVRRGPGGHFQWRSNGTAAAPGAAGGTQEVMMLTSDVSLSRDPAYAKLVRAWAADLSGFNEVRVRIRVTVTVTVTVS